MAMNMRKFWANGGAHRERSLGSANALLHQGVYFISTNVRICDTSCNEASTLEFYISHIFFTNNTTKIRAYLAYLVLNSEAAIDYIFLDLHFERSVALKLLLILTFTMVLAFHIHLLRFMQDHP